MKIPRREEQLEFRLSFKVMFSNMLQNRRGYQKFK